jgi:hypothetical protein
MIEKIKTVINNLNYASLLASVFTFGVMIFIDTENLQADQIILLLLGANLFFFCYIIENLFSRFKIIIIFIILAEIGLYYILCYLNNNFISAQVFLVLCSIILVGSLKPGADLDIWRWQNSLIKSALEAIFSSVLFIGSAFSVIFLIHFVFDITVPKLLPEIIIKFSLTIIASIVFIWRMKVKRDADYFFLLILNYLVIPLWLIYVLLLNIYALRILVSWSLPQGMVSLPITFSFLAMILCWWGLRFEPNTFWSVRLLKIAMYLEIPLLLLFALALGRRIYDYGWTPYRSLLVVYWGFFAEVLYLIIVEKLSARKLALSFWLSQILAFVPI